MRFLLIVVFVFALLFFWRTPAGNQFFGSLYSSFSTETGAIETVGKGVKQAIDVGKAGVNHVQQGVQDIQNNADRIRQGVQKLSSGGKLIEQGLKDMAGK